MVLEPELGAGLGSWYDGWELQVGDTPTGCGGI